MILLIAILLVVTMVGVVAAQLANDPGALSVVWFGYQVETSAAVLVLAVVVLGLLAVFVWHTLARIVTAPLRFAERRSFAQYDRAFAEITHSVAALAASDMQGAAAHTRRAEKILGETPLTLMLRAQISKNEGTDGQTRELLSRLLEYPETEYLAAKSLSDAAEKQQLLPKATSLAERAYRINPKESGGAWSLLRLLLREERFAEAESHIAQARKSKAFDRADARRARGELLLAQAKKSAPEAALPLAKEAASLLAGNNEAVEHYVRLLVEAGKTQEALKNIEQQWKISPSETLAALFVRASAELLPAKKEKLIEKLRASQPDHALNGLL